MLVPTIRNDALADHRRQVFQLHGVGPTCQVLDPETTSKDHLRQFACALLRAALTFITIGSSSTGAIALGRLSRQKDPASVHSDKFAG